MWGCSLLIFSDLLEVSVANPQKGCGVNQICRFFSHFPDTKIIVSNDRTACKINSL